MKICIKCGLELPIEDFYKHPEMKDGHLNECKNCTKKRVYNERIKFSSRIKEYERIRSKMPHRKALNTKLTKIRRKEVDGYNSAHSAVIRAVKKGKIIKSNDCQVCGRKGRLEAHHNSYDDKLNVMWLCPECHRKYHLGKSDEADFIRNKVLDFFNKVG